jgi:hypothetical protein
VVSEADMLAKEALDTGHHGLRGLISRLSEPSWYSVQVKDGVVTLEGTPETISIGHEILDQVRHVQGVVAVRDRLAALALIFPGAGGDGRRLGRLVMGVRPGHDKDRPGSHVQQPAGHAAQHKTR